MDAAEERFVDELRRPDVGGEDDQHHERQLELLPVFSVRKSTRLSSGTIQRFSRSRGEHRCRPKSSMTSTPPLATAWTGARVEAGRRRVAQLERLERQLAADHDHRPPAPTQRAS